MFDEVSVTCQTVNLLLRQTGKDQQDTSTMSLGSHNNIRAIALDMVGDDNKGSD